MVSIITYAASYRSACMCLSRRHLQMAQRREGRQREGGMQERESEYVCQPKLIKRDRKYDDGGDPGTRSSTIRHGRRRKERRDSRRESCGGVRGGYNVLV